jgi:hypothetical protein
MLMIGVGINVGLGAIVGVAQGRNVAVGAGLETAVAVAVARLLLNVAIFPLQLLKNISANTARLFIRISTFSGKDQ